MITHILVALLALQDPPQVRAELIPTRTTVGVPVVFRVTADASGGVRPHIPLPEFPLGLNVVGTSEATATSISVPGGRTMTLTREYVLMPTRAGYYPIPPIRITAGGRAALTESVTLPVAEAVLTNSGSDARIEARMTPDTVYVGQQSTLVAEVFMAPDLQMRLTRPPTYQAPAPAEFWIQQLEQTQLGSVSQNGRRFNTQRFYRAYFPLTAGRFSFAPAKLIYEARQGFVFAPRQFELRSNSPRLVVLPLPTEGRPPEFRGAVGRFTIKSTVEPRQASVGDAVTLTLEVRGAGNIKALPPPELPPIHQVEVLDPAESTEIESSELTVSGIKRFTWVLIPERVGPVEVPAIVYSAFDPATREYTTITTQPATIEVAAAAPGSAPRVGGMRSRPATDPLAFARSSRFALLQIVPLLAVLGALALRKRNAGPHKPLRRLWRAALARAQRDPEPAAAHEQLLRGALYDVTADSVYRSGSVEELDAPLRSLLGAESAESVIELLVRLESARFSRVALSEAELVSISARVHTVLDQLWELARSSRRAAFLPLLLLMQAPGAGAFDAGIEAFLQRDLPRAIEAFQGYTTARPDDANGWYNLGIAYNAHRQPAHAAVAFLHAARLEPRADDVQVELQRAGVDALGRRVRPATGLTEAELLIVLSALWWIACLLVALAILRRSRTPAWLALAPVLAAGILIAVTIIDRALPPPAIVLEQGAPLLAGMNLHAETIKQLQPLTGLTVIATEQGWVRVRTVDGEEGWLREERIGRL